MIGPHVRNDSSAPENSTSGRDPFAPDRKVAVH
jgi:hypothetical protein